VRLDQFLTVWILFPTKDNTFIACLFRIRTATANRFPGFDANFFLWCLGSLDKIFADFGRLMFKKETSIVSSDITLSYEMENDERRHCESILNLRVLVEALVLNLFVPSWL